MLDLDPLVCAAFGRLLAAFAKTVLVFAQTVAGLRLSGLQRQMPDRGPSSHRRNAASRVTSSCIREKETLSTRGASSSHVQQESPAALDSIVTYIAHSSRFALPCAIGQTLALAESASRPVKGDDLHHLSKQTMRSRNASGLPRGGLDMPKGARVQSIHIPAPAGAKSCSLNHRTVDAGMMRRCGEVAILLYAATHESVAPVRREQ
ncbi:hypothetical protein M433DRAFT_132801 [Acidomyces richmondensis BFW]|nr:MAG: hypothetical protein FE78DRAFT_68014 [Acidomyces sp. 'richmondensis']KYG47609.1 hypothetical protein M433DRAFT_132801 [Acidomyces richmondensis BFW]